MGQRGESAEAAPKKIEAKTEDCGEAESDWVEVKGVG